MSMLTIDLRSDTVTRPTDAMRAAMAAAPVGDDQYGEDPTVNALQEEVAALLGKEAALWLPSGTMANQVALRVLTRPGDEVICARECHALWHETGGSAANAGVQLAQAGDGMLFTAADVEAAFKPRGHMIYPPTTLVEVENTHNRGGGLVVPQDEVVRIGETARRLGMALFIDGARLWNAAIASRRSPAELAAPADLVSVALSKGLGAPAGSLLAGSRELIAACLRHRRMLGGAMRQVGILAAAGRHALAHHLERLAEDHAHARLIGERVAACHGVRLDLATLQTNVVVFHLEPGAIDAATLVARARERGVLVMAFAPRTVRAVTHLDVGRAHCERAAEVLAALIEAGGSAG